MTQSIVRYLIVSLFAYLVGHGVITKDIADANVAAWTNYVIIALTIAGGVLWSFLEKKYKGVLAAYLPKTNLGPTSPALVGLLLPILALSVGASVLIGCSSLSGETFTYTPAGAAAPVTLTGFGAWCENNLAVIRSATSASIKLSAQFFIKQGTTASRIAGYVKAAYNALFPLLSQKTVSSADIDTALAKVKVSDTSGIYATAIAPAITLVGGYLVSLSDESAPSKVTFDVLGALLNGLNDAAVALDPNTATP